MVLGTERPPPASFLPLLSEWISYIPACGRQEPGGISQVYWGRGDVGGVTEA